MKKILTFLINILVVFLVVMLYIIYIPFGVIRTLVDFDRFYDFVDGFSNITTWIRIDWYKTTQKIRRMKHESSCNNQHP